MRFRFAKRSNGFYLLVRNTIIVTFNGMTATLTYQIKTAAAPAKTFPVFVAGDITEMAGDYGFFRVLHHASQYASFQLWSGFVTGPLQIIPDQQIHSLLRWNCLGCSSIRLGPGPGQLLPQGLFSIQTALPPKINLLLPAKGSYTWLCVEPRQPFAIAPLSPTIPSLLEERLLNSLFDGLLHPSFQPKLLQAAFAALIDSATTRVARMPIVPIYVGAEKALLGKILETIVLEIDRPLSVTALADRFHVSKSKLVSLFKNGIGITPTACGNQWRLQKAVQLLEEGALPMHEIALACGYTEPKYFSVVFQKQMGCSPTSYRRQIRPA